MSKYLGNPDGVQSLSPQQLEKVIGANVMSFVDAGLALGEIRRARRFADLGFDTFDEYARDRWGMSKSYASRLIGAAEICCQLATKFGDQLPRNASVARALLPLEDAPIRLDGEDLDAVDIWRMALGKAEGKAPAAEMVSGIIKARSGVVRRLGVLSAPVVELLLGVAGRGGAPGPGLTLGLVRAALSRPRVSDARLHYRLGSMA